MRSAFSLVELSIVLVILGLLAGGILTGQALIRAAELRSLATQTEQFQTAIHTFRDKYFAFPGDMKNATDFWGTMTNCYAASPSGSGTQTCNGDGDGEIDNPRGQTRTGETFQFWQHLANAGLIEGQYTGIAGPTQTIGYDFRPGVNVPQLKFPNSVIMVLHRDLISLNTTFKNFTLHYGNYFKIAQPAADGNLDDSGLLTPEELWNMDTKTDDGEPAKGKIIAGRFNSGCTDDPDGTDTTDDFDTAYNLASTSPSCAFFMRNLF